MFFFSPSWLQQKQFLPHSLDSVGFVFINILSTLMPPRSTIENTISGFSLEIYNSYINNMSLPRARVWIGIRARAIASVKGNFWHSYVNDIACRCCAQCSDETQEHLQLCGGTSFERRGLDVSDKRGLLDFWRRMKMKLAAVTWGTINLDFSVVQCTHYISCWLWRW